MHCARGMAKRMMVALCILSRMNPPLRLSLIRFVAFTVVASGGLGTVGCSDSRDSDIENVVLISIDTLRPDHLGFNGYRRPTSPFLDELAADSVVFDNTFAQAPWTAPSHAAMLTSMYPSVLGMGDHKDPGRIADNVETLAETAHAHGLRTKGIAAGGYMAASIGFDQGFEDYDDLAPRMNVAVDRALEWLDGVPDDDPFFLFLHTYDVHLYKPPEPFMSEWVRPYDGPLLERSNIAKLVQGNQHLGEVKALEMPDRRYVLDLYDGGIASVDAQIRRLVDELKARGRYHDTLLVITSDHGEELWDHGRTGHGYNLFDENLRVPLIVHHPSLPSMRVADLVRSFDIAPTITELLGAKTPDAWQGTSLTPLLDGRELQLVAFSEHAHIPYKSVRSQKHKFIAGSRQPRHQLYDLELDPHERTDLINDREAERPTPSGIEERMRHGLRRWIANCAGIDTFRSRSATELSPELLLQLEELGYLGGSDGATVSPDTPMWLEILEDPE